MIDAKMLNAEQGKIFSKKNSVKSESQTSNEQLPHEMEQHQGNNFEVSTKKNKKKKHKGKIGMALDTEDDKGTSIGIVSEKFLGDEKTVPADDTEMEDSGFKLKKRKSENFEETSPKKKIKAHEMKFKDRKLMRKQKENEKYDVVKTLKALWEDFRRDDCNPDRKQQLLKQICALLKGRVKEFAFAHDTSRVLEWVVMLGDHEQRSVVFEALKDDIVLLSKSKYAKFIVMKMLKHCSKAQREMIIKAFNGVVTQLMKHTEAAEVVEMAFNEFANASQRFQMAQEFFGSSYRHFKESEVHNLKGLLEKNPENKTSIINNMKGELLKVLDKSVVKHSLIHHVLLQFFLIADPISRTEVIESLNEVVPEILHTKDGSRVAMHCVWHGSPKDRKVIIKHMKKFVKKIAMEEHGHMVLLALFDCVDDTALVEKVIIKELQESLRELAEHVHGKKVLIYLLNPRDPHFFHPDIVNILKPGDSNEFSKKDPEKRRSELKKSIELPVTQLIETHIAESYRSHPFCYFTVTALKHIEGDKRQAYEAISKVAAEPYTAENKNIHIIESPGSYFMLKQLILLDCKVSTEENSVKFSEVLVNTVPEGNMKMWFHCNRGAFLLTGLIETGIPAVVNRIRSELTGCKKQLGKLNYTGADLLLKKFKELTL